MAELGEGAALSARAAILTAGEAVDALVLGAGPAGATFALTLAPRRRVLVLDRRVRPDPRPGESLPAAAWRILRDIGLWDRFLADQHPPSYCRRSIWGGPDVVETDAIRDLDGHGWQLDRVRFETLLRSAAIERGADLRAPACLVSIAAHSSGWEAVILHDGRACKVLASLLVDARGRVARPIRAFEARRCIADRLICGWVLGDAGGETEGAGIIYTEAEAEGWWYTAPAPGDARIVAFHSDADLAAAADAYKPAALISRARGLPGVAAMLANTRFDPPLDSGFCAAYGYRLDPPCGRNWFAVGDAGIGVDPLASQGILNALYTGLRAAQAADRSLSGDAAGIDEYQQALAMLWDAYQRRLYATYAQEQRWSSHSFWRRRAETSW
jgi:flavin-dependent dehydrogenase